jgi:solute carrier family 6 (neurotransmitter transporter, glycine) member 5/9
MNWNLVIFLAISWFLIFLIIIKGVRSSGKVSYVLAIFPYFLLIILLAKSLTLEGAMDGIKYFFEPKWEKLIEPKVWVEATTQIFFSLGPYFGMVIMYASFNKFDQKSHIHAQIVTTLDTCTSILAGSCVFAILGHLKHELGAKDIDDVIKKGSGMVRFNENILVIKIKMIGILGIFFRHLLHILWQFRDSRISHRFLRSCFSQCYSFSALDP